MTNYKVSYRNNSSVLVEHGDGIVSTIQGRYIDGCFYPHTESLVKHNIDENSFFEYLRDNPHQSNVPISQEAQEQQLDNFLI